MTDFTVTTNVAGAVMAALSDQERDHVSYNAQTGVLSTADDGVATEIAGLLAASAPLLKERLSAYAAARRWAVETGGITVNGAPVYTDRETQSKLTAAHARAADNPSFTVRWKTAAGSFVTLNAAQVTAIANAVFDHVQAAYDVEADVVAGIAGGTITTTAQIDAASWPSNA